MKKFKVLLFLALTAMLSGNAFAASISKIEAVDNNTVEITASNDVVFSDTYVEGDIKVLKDINVSFSVADSANARKVVLNLSDDLEANTSYSLITILGANGNIDFEIWDFLEWEIKNPLLMDYEEWIEKINIVDSRTLELYFNYDLEDDMFEFKILSDIITSWLTSEWNNILNLEIRSNLEKESEYILMVLTLEDINGNTLVFEEDLYDFTTSNSLVEDVEEKEIVLASAEEEVEVEEEWNMNDIALNSEVTPDTGAATWVLVLLTAIVNIGFFLRKRFIK